MDARPRGFIRWWAGADSTPVRRSLVGVTVGAALLVLAVIAIELAGLPGELFALAGIVVSVGIGVFIRSWWAIPASFAGFVLVAWIAETASFLYLGAGEWEYRNREHWQGDDPAAMKLLGQLLEYVVFVFLTVPFVAIGVVIGRAGRRVFQGPEQRQPLGT